MCPHADYYKAIADNYDKFHEAQAHLMTKFILKMVRSSATPDDQIVDVGGGTAHASLAVKEALGMTNPVVCVDPSEAMLAVAKKNGAITIQSTAEEFFASKPSRPLKLVLMNGCVHLFENPDFVFSQLAEYMPNDGLCIITKYAHSSTLPLFKAAKQTFAKFDHILEAICKLTEGKHLNCETASDTQFVEVDKMVWYDSIRSRYSMSLMTFSDAELEDGIQELEEEFKDQSVLSFKNTMKAIILTKM